MNDALLSDGSWLRFLWQSTAWLVTGLAASFVLRRQPARAHAALVVALTGLFITPLANLAVSRFECGLLQPAAAPSSAVLPPTIAPADLPSDQVALESHVPSEQPSKDLEATTVELTSSPVVQPRPAEPRFRITLPGALSAVWLMMSAALAARMALAAWRARRLVTGRSAVVADQLQRGLAEAAARIDLGVTPMLGVADVRSPIVWCWGRSPTVLVPRDADGTDTNIDWVGVFRHELAHWKRRDHLTGLLAQAAIVLLPWHPLTWWAARRLHELSEQACDDWAVADGRSPLDFADALLGLHPENRRRAALAAVSSRRLLSVRVRRLLQVGPANPRPGRTWMAVISGMCLLTVAALALAQSRPEQSAAKAINGTEADAEMHVIGIYGPKDLGKGGRVDVTVRPTSRPVVLVLSSYYSVDWHIKAADGARIKEVIVSGYFTQEATGLPSSVPLVNQSYFPADGSRREKGWFYAFQWNTIEYRRMVETLNDRTGLLVSTAQLEESGTSFVVDGTRGRSFAQKERKPRRSLPDEPTSEQLLAATAGAELHVVGAYHAPAGNGAPVDVEVRPTGKPIVLVMSAYSSVLWNVKVAQGAQLKAVIIGGYFEQQFEGIPDDVPIVYRGEIGNERKSGWFYAYRWNTIEYRRMVETLNDMTGLLVSTAQLEYAGTSFVVDGTRGGNYAQKERKPRRVLPKQPAPEELLAASTDAEMHVVGAQQASGGNGAPVDVEIRPTGKPIVLVMSAYSSVLWNVKITQGAQLKAVIVSGHSAQEFDGIPADIPTVYRGEFKNEMKIGGFYAYRWNTIEYRRMVETLNDMTGLLVSTAQLEYSSTSFVIDGTRGREYAQKERKPRRVFPKEPTPAELLAASTDAELHVVAAYEASGGNGALVDVEIRPTGKPVVLVVSSYSSALWNVKIAPGVKLKAVIIAGYYEQEFDGIPDAVPIVSRFYFPARPPGWFFAYERDSDEYRGMLAAVNEMTGRLVSTAQLQYASSSFVIDGQRGRELAQTEKAVATAQAGNDGGQAPKVVENPQSDVADIPSQDLQAAGDADKRYFLIGPQPNTEPPAEGYGLIVIMPGGDGSADFHPFVKRIYKNALPDGYLAVQPVAIRWSPDQKIVWPTKTNLVAKMKFSTEEFVEAAIRHTGKTHKLDRSKIFSLSWSSSGPAAYALSLQDKSPITGSYIAMSVFNPKFLPPLDKAKGHAYYLHHSREDRVCPFRMAAQAENDLTKNGAKVRLETYTGGHGWNGDVFSDIRQGIEWLEKNHEPADGP